MIEKQVKTKNDDYLIFLISIACFVGLILLYILVSGEKNIYAIVAEIVPDLIATLLIFILIYLFLKRRGILSDKLQNKELIVKLNENQKEIQEIKKLLITDLKLRDNGVKGFYTDRKEFLIDLKKEVREFEMNNSKKGTIKLLGISLRDFFNSAKSESLQMCQIMEKLVVNRKRNFKIKSLIMDPTSNQAEIRRESDHEGWDMRDMKRSYFNIDIDNTIQFFQIRRSFPCELKLYNEIAPFCFLVIFEDYVAVEQYHTGAQGGKIPVIKYRKDSKAGQRFSAHFDFVWKHKSTKLLDEYLKNSKTN